MVDDDVVVFMTDLVKKYREIHVFVEHLVRELLELPMEDFEALAARQLGNEPEGVDAKALEVFVGDQQNEEVVYCVSSDSELQNDHYYEYAEYENDNDNDDDEYIPDFSQFEGHNNAEITNVDHGEPHEVDVEQVCARKAGKAPVVDEQVEENSEAKGSDLEEEPEMQPMNIGEDSIDS